VWIEAVAEMQGVEDHELWPSVLAGQANVAWQRGDPDAALALGLRAVEAEPRGREVIDHVAHYAVYVAAAFRGDHALRDEHLDRAVELSHASSQLTLEAVYGAASAIFKLMDGRLEDAHTSARCDLQCVGRMLASARRSAPGYRSDRRFVGL
jgi:hypothetical protein